MTARSDVLLGSIFGSFGFICLVFIIFYASRHIANFFRYRYQSVEHQLDSEEIEFKKIIEMQSDDIEELFDIPDDELDFDVKEKDRLSMIENYRKNLVATANSDDNRQDVDENSLRL